MFLLRFTFKLFVNLFSIVRQMVAYCMNGDAFGYTSHSFRFVLFQKINLKIYSKASQRREFRNLLCCRNLGKKILEWPW